MEKGKRQHREEESDAGLSRYKHNEVFCESEDYGWKLENPLPSRAPASGRSNLCVVLSVTPSASELSDVH